MAVVAEPGFQRHRAKSHIRIRQQMAGFGQSVANDKPRWRLPEDVFESSLKLAHRQSSRRRQILHKDFLAVMLVDILHDIEKWPLQVPRQRALVEISHDSHDAYAFPVGIAQRVFARDMPTDASVWIGNRFHTVQHSLPALHDLDVIFAVLKDQVCGKKIRVRLSYQLGFTGDAQLCKLRRIPTHEPTLTIFHEETNTAERTQDGEECIQVRNLIKKLSLEF